MTIVAIGRQTGYPEGLVGSGRPLHIDPALPASTALPPPPVIPPITMPPVGTPPVPPPPMIPPIAMPPVGLPPVPAMIPPVAMPPAPNPPVLLSWPASPGPSRPVCNSPWQAAAPRPNTNEMTTDVLRVFMLELMS